MVLTLKKSNILTRILALCLIFTLLLTGCSLSNDDSSVVEPAESTTSVAESLFNPAVIPDYNGQPWVYVNDNQPFFTEDEITSESFENYSELDELGRCGVAFACLSPATQPAENEDRGNISRVQPSGWQFNGNNNNVKYDCVEGGFLYNRCHLIMWALSAENDNHFNLITGTRYLNIDGMLPWETRANEYVDRTGKPLMYRVTPVYTGDNLVADGVLMEAYSVEDKGMGLSFCVYAYNVQPGVEINYATGESWFSGVFFDIASSSVIYDTGSTDADETVDENANVNTYILNTNSKKVHTEDCKFVDDIQDENREEFTGTLQEMLDKGYTGCGSCKPE